MGKRTPSDANALKAATAQIEAALARRFGGTWRHRGIQTGRHPVSAGVEAYASAEWFPADNRAISAEIVAWRHTYRDGQTAAGATVSVAGASAQHVADVLAAIALVCESLTRGR